MSFLSNYNFNHLIFIYNDLHAFIYSSTFTSISCLVVMIILLSLSLSTHFSYTVVETPPIAA